MRRRIRNYKYRVSGRKSNIDLQMSTVNRVDASHQCERQVRPLIFLDSTIESGLQQCNGSWSLNYRPRFQVDVRRVLVCRDHMNARLNRVCADNHQYERSIAVGHKSVWRPTSPVLAK